MNELQRLDFGVFRTLNLGFRSPAADVLFALLSTSALGWLQFAGAIPFALRRESRNAAIRHMVVVLLSTIGPGFKNFVHRDRPSVMLWVHEQETFYRGSFPSGHTTLAFCVAVNAILHLRGAGKRTYWPLFLLWAALAGISRIYRGVHWPTDVLGGIAFGTFIACALDLAWPKPQRDHPATP